MRSRNGCPHRWELQIELCFLVAVFVSWIPTVPEVLKALLSLPAFIVVPQVLGSLVMQASNLTRKRGFNGGSLSYFTIAWVLGSLLIVSLCLLLNLFNLFNIQSIAWGIFYTIILKFIFDLAAAKFLRQESRPTSLLNIPVISNDVGRMLLPVAIIGIAPIVFFRWFTPFPLMLAADELKHNYFIMQMLDRNILDLNFIGSGYLPFLHFEVAIMSVLFKVRSISIFWALPFLLSAVLSLGLFLFCYELRANVKLSLLAATVGVLTMGWGTVNSVTSVVPMTLIYVFWPFLLVLANRTLRDAGALPVRTVIKGGLLILVDVAILALLLGYIFTFLPLISPLISLFQSPELAIELIRRGYESYGYANYKILLLLLWSLLSLLAFQIMRSARDFLRNPPLILLLILWAMINHLYLGIFVSVSLVLYFSARRMPPLGRWSLTWKATLIALLLFGFQQAEIVKIPSYVDIARLIMNLSPEVSVYNFSFYVKFRLLVDTFSPIILIVFCLGSFLILLSKDEGMVETLLMGSTAIIIYFLPFNFSYRILTLTTPFLVTIVASTHDLAANIFNFSNVKITLQAAARRATVSFKGLTVRPFDRRYIGPLFILMIIVASTAPYPFYVVYCRKTLGYGEWISTYSMEEYSAAEWIHDNTPINSLLISDPETMILFRGLSNREPLVSLLEENLNQTTRSRIQSILTDILRTTNASRARSEIETLRVMAAKRGAEVLIVLTGRTSQWVFFQSWAEIVQVKPFKYFSGFSKFYDDAFFKLVHNEAGEVFVFQLK